MDKTQTDQNSVSQKNEGSKFKMAKVTEAHDKKSKMVKKSVEDKVSKAVNKDDKVSKTKKKSNEKLSRMVRKSQKEKEKEKDLLKDDIDHSLKTCRSEKKTPTKYNVDEDDDMGNSDFESKKILKTDFDQVRFWLRT